MAPCLEEVRADRVAEVERIRQHVETSLTELIWSYPFGYPICNLVSASFLDSFLNRKFFRPPVTV